MASEHWFRSHHGAPTDPKWLAIAARAKTQPGIVAATWWALMDHASQNEPRGSAAGFDAEAVAAFFGWPEDVVVAVLVALRDKALIGADDMLAAWDKRQPKREDAGAAERKRRERERKAESVTPPNVTQSHAPSRAVPLEERRGETEEPSGTDVPAAAPPEEQPPEAPDDRGLHDWRSEAAGILRSTYPGGKMPRGRPVDGRPWTMDRELSIWDDLVRYDEPEAVNAAIRHAATKAAGQLFTLLYFRSDRPGAQEFYRECLAEGRKKLSRDGIVSIGTLLNGRRPA